MSNQVQSGGIGLGGAVFLVFLVLKLTDHINWSWWWVTAPLWMPASVALGVAIIALVIGCLVGGVATIAGALAGGGKTKR